MKMELGNRTECEQNYRPAKLPQSAHLVQLPRFKHDLLRAAIGAWNKIIAQGH